MAIDEFGNILFTHDGVVWKGSKDLTELNIVISSFNGKPLRKLCYDQRTKALIVTGAYVRVSVYDLCYD